MVNQYDRLHIVHARVQHAFQDVHKFLDGNRHIVHRITNDEGIAPHRCGIGHMPRIHGETFENTQVLPGVKLWRRESPHEMRGLGGNCSKIAGRRESPRANSHFGHGGSSSTRMTDPRHEKTGQ